ncbi:MAG: hypothetical protein M5R40_29285 [Anaerolineae bacterium]|nr:hypothetical protein [Anaerolineae bacterium]
MALPDGTPVFENLGFAQQSPGVELPPGAYDLGVADAASGDALLQLSRTALQAGRAYTVVVIPSPSGTQIVQPLMFSVATVPTDLTLAVAAPEEEEAAPAAEAEPAGEAQPEEPTPTPIPTATPTAAEAGPIVGTVTTDAGFFLTVRRGPGLSYDPQPIRGLPSGYQVEVAGRDASNDWVYIRASGEINIEGWVSANWIEVTRGNEVVPISELPLAIGGEETSAEAGAEAGVSAPASGGASFTVQDLRYSEDGRQAFMMIHVTNQGLQPALASGNWYPERNADGGLRWVTLLKSNEGDPPAPMIDGNAPLWEFVITLDTGRQFRAYAGCEYNEEIVGTGFEPTAQGGFEWTQTLTGGWFRCGRDYDGSPKPPNDLLPGESFAVPLNIWLIDPRAPVRAGDLRRAHRPHGLHPEGPRRHVVRRAGEHDHPVAPFTRRGGAVWANAARRAASSQMR